MVEFLPAMQEARVRFPTKAAGTFREVPSTGRTWTCWIESRGDPPRRMGHLSPEERLRESQKSLALQMEREKYTHIRYQEEILPVGW